MSKAHQNLSNTPENIIKPTIEDDPRCEYIDSGKSKYIDTEVLKKYIDKGYDKMIIAG